MPKEIERKFLVKNDGYTRLATPVLCRQGYLSTVKEKTVVVRVTGEIGLLMVKGITIGITRTEFEYQIPPSDAEKMLSELCEKPLIEKHRYTIKQEELTWFIDEFHGPNEGLKVAEVELNSETQKIELPDWVGQEVSDDPRYFNANLIERPYSSW